jgi:hypothetical protein
VIRQSMKGNVGLAPKLIEYASLTGKEYCQLLTSNYKGLKVKTRNILRNTSFSTLDFEIGEAFPFKKPHRYLKDEN